MPTHNGNPVFRGASGANAGRGDNPHLQGTGPVTGTNGQAAGGSWSDPAWQASAHDAVMKGDKSIGSSTPQKTAQNMYDQHTIAHADGFVGPRIGESYGSFHDPVDRNSMSGMAPTLQGGMQRSPAGSRIHHNYNGNSGTGDRMAHMDNVVRETEPRMMQHKQTGNIIEVQKMHSGDQVNSVGTSANGRSMEPSNDVNMNPGGRYGAGTDHTSEDYTDISDTVRSTKTYKEGRNGR
jgi:hypothetical protein